MQKENRPRVWRCRTSELTSEIGAHIGSRCQLKSIFRCHRYINIFRYIARSYHAHGGSLCDLGIEPATSRLINRRLNRLGHRGHVFNVNLNKAIEFRHFCSLKVLNIYECEPCYRYEEVKLFTQLLSRLFFISPTHTRPTIVPFSNVPRTMVDHIGSPRYQNMCTLLRKIKELPYAGSDTATHLAMDKARSILKQARHNSNRIVVLLSDGQSNIPSDTLKAAELLKEDGLIVFAVGVANVNDAEIQAVATSGNHTYTLTDFDYIKRVNAYLVGDAIDTDWDFADSAMCDNLCDKGNDCCDARAECYCGTRGGNYSCACNAGYSGTGHVNDCYPCPRGTFKNEVGNRACTACPEHSTTSTEGSDSSHQCVCLPGFIPEEKKCKPVQCPRLRAPAHGVLIPSQCNHTYGSECTFRCKEGFCEGVCSLNPQPPQPRLCLESGHWSGDDFHCEMRRCPALDHPEWGSHNCSGQEFSSGTVCSYQCENGFKLSGDSSRSCLSNGSWTGASAHCEAITCPPLKTNNQLKVTPKPCGSKPMRYNSLCSYYCSQNYSLVSDTQSEGGVLTCQANGTWSGITWSWYCADVTPPVIHCPPSADLLTDRGLPTAQHQWSPPAATDNVFVDTPILTRPRNLGRPPYAFRIGTTKVTYEVRDSSNLKSSCSFNVVVKDKEPPTVLSCPDNIEIFSKKKTVAVKWQEPKFSDNSGELKSVRGNRRSGDIFAWGSDSLGVPVTYIATDYFGNQANCTFRVNVKPYSCETFKPPKNGVVTCDGWQGGQLCSAFCRDGFEFAANEAVPSTFKCKQAKNGKSTWEPFPGYGKKYKMPLPDCIRKSKKTALNITQRVDFEVDECSEEILNEMREKFVETIMPLENLMKGMICPKHLGCRPQNVKVICISSSRSKRDVIKRSKRLLSITFDVVLVPEIARNPPEIKKAKISRQRLMKELESITFKNVKDFYNVSKASLKYSSEIDAICTLGQLKKNNSCVSCPAGTYLPVIGDNCLECPRATFQDLPGSVACQPCPLGYTTDGIGSRSSSDCRAPCRKGYYSRTTFDPCFPCPAHTYQNKSGSQECIKCPPGRRTPQAGAISKDECASPCQAGYYSVSGLEPCNPCERGLYQNETGQADCKGCTDGKGTRNVGCRSSDDCIEIDACSELSPCSESSTCVSASDGDYTCVCPLGLFGKHCENRVDPCSADTCVNGGTCQRHSDGSYSCICPSGLGGKDCEIDLVDDCKGEPCKNGGTCVDLINSYECVCLDGFEGSRCQVNLDECSSQPCQNGGTCFDMINDYRCCCPHGYAGKDCSTVHDPCALIDCRNGGSCTGNGKCTCAPGFSGMLCEEEAKPCEEHGCHHNGSCVVNDLGHPECICTARYAGMHCEEESLGTNFTLHFSSPASTQHFVHLRNQQVLSEVTVSFFARSDSDKESRPTPLSYAYTNPDGSVQDNGFTIYDLNKVILFLHGEAIHTGYSANNDRNWHHYAVTWSKQHGRWTLFVDGKEVAGGKAVGENTYLRPGVFVIGQEQDSLGGSFSVSEAFAGDISQLNVWDWRMSEDEVVSIAKSCGRIGNVVAWSQARYQKRVSVQQDVSFCQSVNWCSSNDCDCFDTKGEECRPRSTCLNMPCAFEQPCESSSDGFHFCRCDPGFFGRYCDIDVDECAVGSAQCSHFCNNTPGSFECSCPDDLQLSSDGHTCIDGSFCKDGEQIFLDGETWEKNCFNCTCNKGETICQKVQCEAVDCIDNLLQDYHLVKAIDECCPRCIAYETCTLFTNSSLVTFGGSVVEIPEMFQIPILEDCVGAKFSFRLDSERGSNSDPYSGLIFYDGCTKLPLISSWVNESSITADPSVFEIQFPYGLSMKLQQDLSLDIRAPVEAKDSLCGLCIGR